MQAVQNSAKAGGTHTHTPRGRHFLENSPKSPLWYPRTYTREKAILLLFGHLSKLQHSPHPHARGAPSIHSLFVRNLTGTHTHTRFALLPRPRGAGAVMAIAPRG